MAFKVGKSSRAKVIEWTITNHCKDPYKPISIMRCRVLNGAGMVVLVHSSYFYPDQNGEIIQFELYIFSTALQETTTYGSCLQVVASYFFHMSQFSHMCKLWQAWFKNQCYSQARFTPFVSSSFPMSFVCDSASTNLPSNQRPVVKAWRVGPRV